MSEPDTPQDVVIYEPKDFHLTRDVNVNFLDAAGLNFNGEISVNGVPFAGNPFFDTRNYGAVGDGVVNDRAAIQAAIDAAELVGGGTVYLAPGNYRVTGEILLPSNVKLSSASEGGQVGLPVKLTYAGSSGDDRMIGPKNRAINTINIGIEGVELNGAGLVDVVLDLFRVSYSNFKNFSIYGGLAVTGVGILLDANVVNQCYFNQFDGVKLSGLPVGIRFQSGANVNHWRSGTIIGGGTGMEFLSNSAGNVIWGGDQENLSVKHYRIDAPANVFIGMHLESCPLGFDITANGSKTCILVPTIAGTVVTWITDLSAASLFLMERAADTFRLKLGSTWIDTPILAGSTSLNIDPQPLVATGDIFVRLFRFLTTSGARQFNVHRGDGSATSVLLVDCVTTRTTVGGPLTVSGQFDHDGTTFGALGTAPALKQTVTGSRGGNAALASLLTAMANFGFITDSSTA